MDFDLKGSAWWNYIDNDLRELLSESVLLLSLFETRYSQDQKNKNEFEDYSFLVFPAAKAYEGFLKKVFLDLGFITQEEYFGKHFRIGRALNPSLEKVLRESESVYDKLVAFCGGAELAERLWETWKLSRNQTFHWFPGETNKVGFDVARERVGMVLTAMDEMFKGCKLEKIKE
jgi:hypothetical protein